MMGVRGLPCPFARERLRRRLGATGTIRRGFVTCAVELEAESCIAIQSPFSLP